MVKSSISFLLSIFLTLCLLTSISAQNKETLSTIVVPSFSYYLDSEEELDLDKVTSGFVTWEKSKGHSINLGNKKGALWMKVDIQLPDTLQRIIELQYVAIDTLVCYQKSPKGWKSEAMGFVMPYANRILPGLYLSFLLPKTTEAQTLYFKLKTYNAYVGSFEIKTEKQYYLDSVYKDLWHGIFFGLCIVMSLYNLMVYFSLKDKDYLYYVFTNLSPFVMFFVSGGYLMWILPENPILNNWALRTGFMFITLSTGLFARRFLQVKKYAPIFNKLILLTMSLSVIAFLSADLVKSFKYSNLSITIHAPLILVTGYVVWRRGFKPARFFVIAWFFYVLFGILSTLRNLGIVPDNFLTFHGVKIGAGLEIILLALALSDKYNQYRKDKEKSDRELLEMQRKANEELENNVLERTAQLREAVEELHQTNEELNAVVELVNNQKESLERQNQDIRSSIYYAKRIQDSMLMPENRVKLLYPNSFTLFLPRDIVSGDFYYFGTHFGIQYVAAVDCTGHGVPGAFMSMIGHEILDQILRTKASISTAEIVSLLHRGVNNALKQDHTTSRDGMDLVLCAFHPNERKAYFTGAMNALYHVPAGSKELMIYQGNKVSIGGELPSTFEGFDTTEITYSEGDQFYFCSDGFQDQFGGPNNKKYLKKHFRQLLQKTSMLPMSEQKKFLEDTLTIWMGADNKQIDDILIIGVEGPLS